MSSLIEVIRQKLLADSVVATHTGTRVHTPDSLGRNWLELQDIQSPDVGNPLVLPSIFLRESTTTPMQSAKLGAERMMIELYYYQDSGFDKTRLLRDATRRLFDKQNDQFTEPAGYYVYQFIWAGDLLAMRDEELSASMERSRYEVHILRK